MIDIETGRRMKWWAVVLAAMLLCLGSCSSNPGDSDLEQRIEDLEEDLNAATSSNVADTEADNTPDVDTLARLFEDEMNRTMASAAATLDENAVFVEYHDAEECQEILDLYWGLTITEDDEANLKIFCGDLHRTLALDTEWTYDITRTDSVIAPMQAVSFVGFQVTTNWHDRLDRPEPVEEEGMVSDTFILRWRFLDGEWQLSDVSAEETSGFEAMGLALLADGVPPSEAGSNSAPGGFPLDTTTTETPDDVNSVPFPSQALCEFIGASGCSEGGDNAQYPYQALCEFAATHPDAGAFIENLFVWHYDNDQGGGDDSRRAIVNLIEGNPQCDEERERAIIQDTRPFLSDDGEH